MSKIWMRRSRKGDKFIITLGGVPLVEIQMKSVGDHKTQMCFIREDKVHIEHVQVPKRQKGAT